LILQHLDHQDLITFPLCIKQYS